MYFVPQICIPCHIYWQLKYKEIKWIIYNYFGFHQKLLKNDWRAKMYSIKKFEVVFYHVLTKNICLNYAFIQISIMIWHFWYKKRHYYIDEDNYWQLFWFFHQKNSKFNFLLHISWHFTERFCTNRNPVL